jgi:hypothetical protein
MLKLFQIHRSALDEVLLTASRTTDGLLASPLDSEQRAVILSP